MISNVIFNLISLSAPNFKINHHQRLKLILFFSLREFFIFVDMVENLQSYQEDINFKPLINVLRDS